MRFNHTARIAFSVAGQINDATDRPLFGLAYNAGLALDISPRLLDLPVELGQVLPAVAGMAARIGREIAGAGRRLANTCKQNIYKMALALLPWPEVVIYA